MTLEETILEKGKIMEAKILGVDIEEMIETGTLEEVEVGLGKDTIQVPSKEMTDIVVVGLVQVQEPVLIGDRIRCFKCREYNHFAKDCPNLQTGNRVGQHLH